MRKSHGDTAASKLISAPHSRSFSGPFGRMFRTLPAWDPGGADEATNIGAIATIADEMSEAKAGPGETGDNETIPAGYTYFGQFVDHDLTFDPRSSLQKQNDPESLQDFRSPAFDLDCLYGRGPADQPYMYEDGKFRIATHTGRPGEDPADTFDDEDLPRYGGANLNEGTALIGDKRNDENIFVSQFQLAFLKFHNRVFDEKTDPSLGSAARFAEAQRICRWHYQWVVVHDWLERLCGDDVVDKILRNRDCPSKPKLCYYGFREHPFMPVEFSAAAYRLGHSMIRGGYRINPKVAKPTFTPNDDEGPFGDFRGFKTLPAGWTVDWSFFFDFSPLIPQQTGGQPKSQTKPALSRKLDRFLAGAVVTMPKPIADPADVPAPAPGPNPDIARSLGFRNLLRGWRLGLPSGQAVAAFIGVKKGETEMDLEANTPLWRYILDEAGSDGQGERLGRVGATIVAETFIGLLAADPSSYLRNNPLWKPDLVKPIGSKFELRDILRFAGARIAS